MSDFHGRTKSVRLIVQFVICCLGIAASIDTAMADAPNPILQSVFPSGGAVGATVDVTVRGTALGTLRSLRCTAPDLQITQDVKQKNVFRVTIPRGTPLGQYDLRAVGTNGLSSPMPFVIGNRVESNETQPNDLLKSAPTVELDLVINGRIEKSGDIDCFQFTAKRGQRVIIECEARRIASRLRAVLEIFDGQGGFLASSRGYFGVDPLIDFQVPSDGVYVVKIHDLTFSTSAQHFYRLAIDTGPRVAFAVPPVVQRGKPARVTLFGWNLGSQNARDRLATPTSAFDRVEVTIPADMVSDDWPLPIDLRPAQAATRGFTYQAASSHAPVFISATDLHVESDGLDNHKPAKVKTLNFPCEVGGQLVDGDEQDWFAVNARRGEVLYLEGFADRINSPVDLDIRILDAKNQKELDRLGDERRNVGGKSLPTNHLDPAGRWVVPADGRYLILVRNLIGGSKPDPRRTYRLSIRREEPDFDLIVVPHKSEPAGLNVPRGGSAMLDVIALRRRGLNGTIRVSAERLPEGVECPDVWLGPGVDRAPLVVTASQDAPGFFDELSLNGFAEFAGTRQARGGVVVSNAAPVGIGRLASDIPLAVVGDAPLQITANGHEPRSHAKFGSLQVRHSPGGIVDVAVHVRRSDSGHQAPVNLVGVGLPPLIENQTATIPPGAEKGYISFYLPPNLPTGRYSLAVQAESTTPDSKGKPKATTALSNVVSFDVHPPAFRMEIDRSSPTQIKRGEVIQVKYAAHRVNGFISKIHTEIASPEKVTDVIGLRARGVTFVGQTDTGTLQIIANEDAPLGQLPFLRLYGVGVLEDEAVFHGSCFLTLKVIE